jgi:hypothetical protein
MHGSIIGNKLKARAEKSGVTRKLDASKVVTAAKSESKMDAFAKEKLRLRIKVQKRTRLLGCGEMKRI